MENIMDSLAKKIYELFVVNPYAIAIQQDDGKYTTKYFPYDYFLLKGMLEKRGAAGCYQQGFKNGLIKWICLDFDCKDKAAMHINDLYTIIEERLLKYLDEMSISYLTEFSGRRGIHVWILFSNVFSKSLGFEIINLLSNRIVLDENIFGLDIFPATDSSKGNKVGKQVKFPLSCHKDGGQSFVFVGKPDFECIYKSDFYDHQYKILCEYHVNDIDLVCEKLGIRINGDLTYKTKYKKYQLVGGFQCTAEIIENILGEISVYRKIFERLHVGTPVQKDWFVLLGTLGNLDREGTILRTIFSCSPAYDEKITGKNILTWKNKYFPATFSYLYKIYGLEIEEGIEESQTGLDYLRKRIYEIYNVKIELELIDEPKSEREYLEDIRLSANKEKFYLLSNDENMVITVWNTLNHLTEYDFCKMQLIVNEVLEGKRKSLDSKEYYKFLREESEDKQRELIVLGAYDRVITTHLAIMLAYRNYKLTNSFSYNVAFLSKEDIFYNWYTSWGNYIDKIKMYLEIPYLDDLGVIVIDIKKFYDSINFLTIYNLMKDELDDESKRIFEFLIKYNEELMRKLNNSRIGVPQGPAYARIVSEMFIDRILKFAMNCEKEAHYTLYRYVDDIIIFYDEFVDGKKLYNEMCKLLISNGLEINTEKSKLYGKIATLSEKDRRSILRKDKFNYMLQNSDINTLLMEEEKGKVYDNAISNKFKMEDVAFIFSKKTNEFYVYKYFKKYKEKIFASSYGRGSTFMRFYKYIFSNRKFILEAVDAKCFESIPINSLNFKNCISSLYYVVQTDSIDLDMFEEISNQFLKKIKIDDIDKEERITINSLLRWDRENG